MKTESQAMPGQGSSLPMRSRLVIMGRQDFTSVLLRLIGLELYKIRRRAMSKVFITLCITAMVFVFVPILLFALLVSNNPPLPPTCSDAPNVSGCLQHEPSPADLARIKQETLHDLSQPLRLPNTMSVVIEVMNRLGVVLMIILVGTIVGGEYGVGTVRLMLTRGPTRTQFLLSKIGAALVCIVVGLPGTLLIGIGLGQILNLFTGVVPSFTFLTAAWLGHALLYLLAAILGLFVYSMMALSFSTLGKATPAGIAGGLIWWGVEPVLGLIFTIPGNFMRGPIGTFLSSIPDYFIGNNIAALVSNQGQYLFGDRGSNLSDLHALLVLAVYLAIFIGLAWWVSVQRDVTN